MSRPSLDGQIRKPRSVRVSDAIWKQVREIGKGNFSQGLVNLVKLLNKSQTK